MKFQKKNLKDDYKLILWVDKYKVWKLMLILVVVVGTALIFGVFALINMGVEEQQWNPPEGIEEVEPTPSPEATTKKKKKTFWTGIASWYSREGCVGCSENLLMANGEPLRDNKKTVAFNRLPLGSVVKIRNMENNRITTARVADRGGFESLGRIIDLTPAVKEALNCGDLCKVRVYEK